MGLSTRWTDCEQVTPDALLTETLTLKPETASLDHVVDPVHVKISCHQNHPSRLIQSDEVTDQAHSVRHSTDARPYIIFGSATMLEFVSPNSPVGVVLSLRSGLVLSLVVCGEVGPSTASLANRHPCTVDVLQGPTGVI